MLRVLVLALLLLQPFKTVAAPGDLDTSFGQQGWIVTTVSGFSLKAADVEIQNDGKIVVCGYAENDTTSYFMVARYHSDGRLDETFAGNQAIATPRGIVIRDLPDSTRERGFICALQPDGKIVVAGHGYKDGKKRFAIARYRSDNGLLDASFDEGGWTYTLFQPALAEPVEEAAYDIAIYSNKIIVVGFARSPVVKKFAVARYNIDGGSLDTSFDGDGKVVVDIPGSNDIAHAVAIQNDGKIVVAGYTSTTPTGENNQFALARLKGGTCAVDSCLDTTFGGDGKEVANFEEATEEMAYDIILQPNGKIVSVGRAKVDDSWQFALAQYKSGTCPADVCLDRAVTTDFEGSTSEFAVAVKIKGDKIVVAGFATIEGKQQLALAGYHLDTGLLDESFGSNGKAIINHPSFENEGLMALAIQEDKILAVGTANNGENSSVVLSRYLDTFLSDLVVEMRENPNAAVEANERSYIITVTNNGPDDASDVVVIVTPPAGVLFRAVPYLCENQIPLSCEVGDIASGENFSFGLIADLSNANEEESFSLTVSGDFTDLNMNNNSALLNVSKGVSCPASDPECTPEPLPETQGAGGGCMSIISTKSKLSNSKGHKDRHIPPPNQKPYQRPLLQFVH